MRLFNFFGKKTEYKKAFIKTDIQSRFGEDELYKRVGKLEQLQMSSNGCPRGILFACYKSNPERIQIEWNNLVVSFEEIEEWLRKNELL